MILNNKVDRFCIDEKSTILQALNVINNGEERICFLVDSNKRLVRVVTDGDIRRALLNGFKLEDEVKKIHNKQPCIIKEGQNIEDAAKHYLSRRIAVVPIVNHEGQIKGLVQFHDVEHFINIKSRKVLVFGLGYVGVTLAVILADCGFTVYGYDADRKLIDSLKMKKSTFYEDGIENYLDKHVGNNLKFLNTLDDFSADIHIICVGTPIDKKTKEPNVGYIMAAVQSASRILKKNDLVILRSTVPIGTTRKVVIPLLEKESGLKIEKDFFLAYCPERTAEGRALKELLTLPQIIGGYGPKSAELASRLFNENTHTVINMDSLEAAEMCKLIDNTFRDTIFAYSNLMASLCEKLGLNLTELIENVNLGYNRNRIPKPSPGVGGACLSKDPYILIKNFEEFNLDCSLIRDARKVNEMAPQSIFKTSQKLMNTVGKDLREGKVFIIGFAFKGYPETSDMRDSTTLWFVEELKSNNVSNIWGYDPVVDPCELEKLNVIPTSLKEGFYEADAVFIMNNHRSYTNMPIFELLNTMNKTALFFDGWQIFRASDIRDMPGILYAGVGVG